LSDQKIERKGFNNMMISDKIQLTEEKETLFITLFAKALDYRSRNSILNDVAADNLVRKARLDPAKHPDFGNRVLAVRAKQYDEWITDFITKNGDAVVVYLGCGLDTRIIRIQPPLSIKWFDIDYPEVISLRKSFFSETDKYKMIPSSITAEKWLESIPADKPTLIIAEGVLEYLSEQEVKELLVQLTTHFSHGQIVFDVMNTFAVNSGKEKLKKTTGAVHKWVVDDINQVDKLNPKLRRVEVMPLFKSTFMKKLPLVLRSVFSLLSLFPKFKNMIRLVRYDF
jgi:O-methyltransferase involved in polyketide biosynthesis